MDDRWQRDEDPEVAADLELRERSMYDHDRTRGLVNALGTASPAVPIDAWPCRVRSCRMPVQITRDAMETLEVMNGELARRDEEPIGTGDVMFCPVHALQVENYRIQLDEQLRAKVREYVIELGSDEPRPSAERERDLMEKLRALGHPDVDGLAGAIRERRKKQEEKAAKPRRRV